MKTAKIAAIAALYAVGLALTGVKTAYGSDQGKTHQTKQVGLEEGAHDAAKAKVVGVESIDVVLPTELHGQKLRVPAKLFKPKYAKKVGKRPAVLVMHGSGGLTKMSKSRKSGEPCSDELEEQFVRWGERLARRGYVVLMPSSYSARGFCDMHVDTKRIPKTFDDRPEAILSRMYDMDAASRYLCDRPDVDCDRMGVLGFSHGATMAMLALHWQIDHALDRVRKEAGRELDIDVPDLAPGRPEFQVGVAYYPGCGTDGVLPLETDAGANVYDKYYPTADLYVLHGAKDPLATICAKKLKDARGKVRGERQIQAGQVAGRMGVDDTYHITVYPNADHGFDNAGSAGDDEKSDGKGDVAARDEALDIALRQLDAHLK